MSTSDPDLDSALLGPNGATIAAALTNTVGRLNRVQADRLATHQMAAQGHSSYKNAHWQVNLEFRTQRAYSTAIYYARMLTVRRLRTLKVALESPEAEATVTAVIGHIMCLYAYPDLSAYEAGWLNRAWATVLG
jgi:hypothetical protein